MSGIDTTGTIGVRPPGVYASHAPPQRSPLAVNDTRVAGFVGLARRGPLHEPVRVSSWDEFVDVFVGEGIPDPAHYLTTSVEAYFRNGGGSCYVVRVAHLPDRGAEPTLDHAACSERALVDEFKKPTLVVRARSEGRWGNSIWASCAHSTGAQALLTQDLEVGAGEARVSSTRGFEVGQLVEIRDREHADFVILTEVGERVIRWGSATPVNRVHRAASPTRLEVKCFELHVALRDRKEVFKGLQLSPTSRRYAPRVIADESRLVSLADCASGSPPPNNLPTPAAAEKLSGGRDGDLALTPEDIIARLKAEPEAWEK